MPLSRRWREVEEGYEPHLCSLEMEDMHNVPFTIRYMRTGFSLYDKIIKIVNARLVWSLENGYQTRYIPAPWKYTIVLPLLNADKDSL